MEEKEDIAQLLRDDFAKRYRKEVAPQMDELEKEREQSFRKAIFICLGIIAVSIIVFVAMVMFKADSKLFKIPFFIFFLSFIIYGIIQNRFEHKLKEKVMPIACKCFPDLKWSLISRERFDEASYLYKNSNLIDYFDEISFDDCFYGSFDNVHFDIEECHAVRITRDSEGKESEQTVFEGAIITVDMNKNFKGNTVVRPNSIFNNVFAPSFKLHKTKLEDVEFEKKFDVFTDDEVEARYLLTTAFMERLNKIQVAFKANKVSASFYEEKLYIALHTNKDLFKLGSLRKTICDEKQFFTMFEEILSIVMLIDHFKLNQKIGL